MYELSVMHQHKRKVLKVLSFHLKKHFFITGYIVILATTRMCLCLICTVVSCLTVGKLQYQDVYKVGSCGLCRHVAQELHTQVWYELTDC